MVSSRPPPRSEQMPPERTKCALTTLKDMALSELTLLHQKLSQMRSIAIRSNAPADHVVAVEQKLRQVTDEMRQRQSTP
jgi:hypothetical protein